MAGASLAAELSASARVLLLEREEQPGYHSTGRSAAAYIPSYGHDNAGLRVLTECSLAFLQQPPDIFQVPTVLHPRGLLTLAPPGQESAAEAEFERLRHLIPNLGRVDGELIRQKIPLVREDYLNFGWYEPDVFDMDVHVLHEGYLRTLRRRGGQLVTRAEITRLRRRGGLWQVSTRENQFSAALIVNAAGAWADEVASLAGVNTVGLMPLRRTVVLLEPPETCDVSGWPLLLASDGSFYLKPDAGLILVSPADEHPSQPCDARPDEIDIACAVHHAQQALQVEFRTVKHSWSGLRNFVADRTPVIGFAPDAEGFFWLAGQGGHGIQTAPAAARVAASILLGQEMPADFARLGFDADWVSPSRLARDAATYERIALRADVVD